MQTRKICFNEGMWLRVILIDHILLRHEGISDIQLSLVDLLGDPLTAGNEFLLRGRTPKPFSNRRVPKFNNNFRVQHHAPLHCMNIRNTCPACSRISQT